jgi:hypothetical protein
MALPTWIARPTDRWLLTISHLTPLAAAAPSPKPPSPAPPPLEGTALPPSGEPVELLSPPDQLAFYPPDAPPSPPDRPSSPVAGAGSPDGFAVWPSPPLLPPLISAFSVPDVRQVKECTAPAILFAMPYANVQSCPAGAMLVGCFAANVTGTVVPALLLRNDNMYMGVARCQDAAMAAGKRLDVLAAPKGDSQACTHYR